MMGSREAKPCVTVIIPTYNRAHLITHAIDSVLHQTYQNFELIVVDDGSQDNTSDVLANYRGRLYYIRQSHLGSSEARNTALRMAKGDYIAFLDSDDRWLPTKLEKQLPFLESDESTGLVHTYTSIIGENGEEVPAESRIRLRLHQQSARKGYSYEVMSKQCIIWPSTILVRRECFDQSGFDPRVEAFEDWDLYLRIALKYRLVLLPETLVQFRIHKNHRTNREFVSGRVNTCLKHLDILDKWPDLPFREQARKNFIWHLATAYYMTTELEKCRKYSVEALKKNPCLFFNFHLIKQILISFLPRSWIKALRKRKGSPFESVALKWPGLKKNF